MDHPLDDMFSDKDIHPSVIHMGLAVAAVVRDYDFMVCGQIFRIQHLASLGDLRARHEYLDFSSPIT
jgi:hypothetical protein